MAYAARRPTFWIKAALIVGLVALADWALFDVDELGANLGVVALAWTAGLAAANPATFRSRLGRLALLAAAAFAVLQFERPSFVGLALFAIAFGVAALALRAPELDDAWRWAQRLVLAALKTLWGPFVDLRRLRRARARKGTLRIARVVLAGLLPIVGGLLFMWLFSLANPVISEVLGGYAFAPVDFARILFWAVVAFPVVAALRPRGSRRLLKLPKNAGDLDLPGVTAASITLSLVVFNVIFAMQNGLDIAFLWSGAHLPGDLTFAEYAHRGAYPLIATAILAGLFVLVFLRPGSATATAPLVRPLVIVWVAQNIFLVASTALRTLDYIDAYSLTPMRIAALLWMGLVAVGLLLILWRLLRAKSSGWLINANTAAVATVLVVCSVIDLSSITAAWNVRHAREVGGRGVALDLCYMRSLKGGAVVPLNELAYSLPPGEFKLRVQRLSWILWRQMWEQNGSNWRHFRLRDARRYAHINNGPGPVLFTPGSEALFTCDGSLIPPPPLTQQANPGT